MSEYKTVSDFAESVSVIERSKFICLAGKTETEEEAKSFISSARKKYPQANHYCYAYVSDGGNVQKFSDDGEPHGTAGMPILNAIIGRGLVNVTVVVVRYFGGIKLGTGGLSRAYGGVAADALDKTKTVILSEAEFYSLTLSYSQYRKVSNLLAGVLTSIEFGSEVELKIAVKSDAETKCALISEISDILGGEFKYKSDGKGFYEFK